MISIHLTILMILISDISGESESTHQQSSQSTKEDKNQRSLASDYWKHHKYNLDQLYAKYHEGKSNNEPFFSEPNNNNDHLVSLRHGGGWNQRPIYYISKESDWFSWLIPLLLFLGAHFLLGIVLIPVALKSVLFILKIGHILGGLVPLPPAMTGGINPLIPIRGQ